MKRTVLNRLILAVCLLFLPLLWWIGTLCWFASRTAEPRMTAEEWFRAWFAAWRRA